MPNFAPPPNQQFGWVWRIRDTYAIVKNEEGKNHLLIPSGMMVDQTSFYRLKEGTPITFEAFRDPRGTRAIKVRVGFQRE